MTDDADKVTAVQHMRDKMADSEHGWKWWVRFVVVPLIGGGGIIAVIIALMIEESPTATMPQSAVTTPIATPEEQSPPEKQSLLEEHDLEAFFAILLEDFPEAKENFVTISFKIFSGNIYPETASFLIGSDYYSLNPISEENYKVKAANFVRRLYKENTLTLTCESVEVGPEGTYAYYPDIRVRRVTLWFHVGC